MFKNTYIRTVLLFCAVFSAIILRGQPPVPDRPSPPRLVNDMANLLSPDERNRLENDLVAYSDSTSNQIAIITLQNLGDYPVEDWALEIGRKWGVGKKSKNNGVVIIVSLQPKKINISPGYGLEGALPDVICKRIEVNEMRDHFKAGQFYEGLDKGVKAIRTAIKGEYTNEDKSEGDDGSFFIFFIIFIIIIIAFIIFLSRKNKATYYGPNRRQHYDNGGGWIFWGGGGGNDWGHNSGSGDSGGFDGFGGGDFGGGGASSDW